jgi:dephospho-CoA kinase
MIKVGITGSIASGKTISSKILSRRRGPLFSADMVVKELYTKIFFKKIISKTFAIKQNQNFKKEIKRKILEKKKNIKKLEQIIHPLVRKEMFLFNKKNRRKKILFFEIPLLVESNLSKHFDSIIFIKAKKKLRLTRYLKNGGDKKLFLLLDNHQMKDAKKAKHCDHIVVNNKSLSFLKNKLFNIIRYYE